MMFRRYSNGSRKLGFEWKLIAKVWGKVTHLGDSKFANTGLGSFHCQPGGEVLGMTLLRGSLLSVVLAGCSVVSFAAKIPTNLNDNVVRCGQNALCSNKVMFGRNYKVMQTAKFTVMVSISNEAAYTRADVSIENHADYSQNISPQDFRVEVVSPKAKVLLYVPPAQLQNLPVNPVVAAAVAPAAAVVQTAVVEVVLVKAASAVAPATPVTPNIDELYAAAKQAEAEKLAAEKTAALKHLVAAAIPANDVVRGRVYFEKDPKAKQVNVVIPVSGMVFEFPYSLSF
jgi:hypothetical protein